MDRRQFLLAGAGLAALVIEDASRHIDVGGSLAAAWKKMGNAGVRKVQSADFAA
jgi:nicotinamidase/pyrazinamidase